MRTPRPAPAVRRALVVAGTLLLLTGCTRAVSGTATPPPHAGALVQAMYTTMSSRPGGFAVHSTATLGGPTLEGQIRLQGDDASGTFSLGDLRCELRRVGGRDYGRAPAAFWTTLGVHRTAAAAVDGRWASFDATIGLAGQLRLTSYLTGYRTASDGQFAGVQVAQLAGRPVWQVVQDGTILSISQGPQPRLLKVATKIGDIEFMFPTDDLQVSAPAGAIPLPD